MNKLSLSKREEEAKDFLEYKVVPAMRHILKEAFNKRLWDITKQEYNFSYYFAYFLRKKLDDYEVNVYQADLKCEGKIKPIVRNHRWIYIEHKENELRKILLDYNDGTEDWGTFHYNMVDENELPANIPEYKDVYRVTPPVLVDQESEGEMMESEIGIPCYQLLMMIDSHLKLT